MELTGRVLHKLHLTVNSDTTASTLVTVLYYLAKDLGRQKKLQALIDQNIPNGYSAWTYERAKTISYIDDVIQEALRLKPPVLTIPPRETPPAGIQIGDTYIPGHVNVFVSSILIHTDPRWWEEADSFIPERWGERRAEMKTDEAPYFPFNIGKHMNRNGNTGVQYGALQSDQSPGVHACVGKELAYVSLRTSISSIFHNFDVALAPEEDGEKFDKHFLDTQIIDLPPLSLLLKSRKTS